MTDREQQHIILVVDDSLLNRVLLDKIFSSEFRVIAVENGIKALEVLHTNKNISVVILDLYMPELDGFGVLEAMRDDERLREIPVVVNTASNDVENQLMAFDRGAVDVMIKPNNSEVVLHRIRNIIARRESDRLTAQNKLYAELLYQSERDDKSGIYTRQAFCRKTAELLQTNPDKEYVLFRWDIDRFKVFNDAFGVNAGDDFLKSVGEVYQSSALSGMTYGHWEADHFVTCMERDNFSVSFVTDLLSEVRKKLNINFNFIPRIGVYIVDDPDIDIALMCDRALLALTSIKYKYAESLAYYDESMRVALIEEQQIVSEMQNALSNGQFIVYLQPQYNYYDNTIHGAEALVRWQHPEKGLLSPDKFIPIFERNGFICQVDEYVWEEVCRLQRFWLDEKLPVVPVSINVSRRDIYNPNLCDIFSNLIEKYRLVPSLIRLEITESAYMENPEQLIKTVEGLRDSGFSVEMDDFGSGYSSLNTLKDVPVDTLKLDMKFLGTGSDESRSGNILSSIIRMAHWLKVSVVAEGVETREQADFLKTISCRYMQGYYFARPMPVIAYEELLRNSRLDSSIDRRLYSDIKGAADFLNFTTQTTLLFNSFVGGAAIIEYDGNNVEALRLNDQFFKVLGTDREGYEGRQSRLLDNFLDKSRYDFISTILTAVSTGEEADCELHSKPLTPDGESIWTHARMRFLARNAGRYVLYLSIENITERKKLLLHNVELVQQLTTIIDNVPSGILDLEYRDGNLLIAYFNNMVASMFGYSRDEYTEKFIKDPLSAVYTNDRDVLRQNIQSALAGEAPRIDVRYRHLCADGSLRRVWLTGRVLRRTVNAFYATATVIDIEHLESSPISEI